MIYSRLNNFLFIKGRKVAGTSVEVALSKICGPDDIITPIMAIDERQRLDLGYRHAQNYGADETELANYIRAISSESLKDFGRIKSPAGNFNAHASLIKVSKKLKNQLEGTRILCLTRSPYQCIISYINFRAKMMAYSKSGEAMTLSNANIRKAIPDVVQQMTDGTFKKNSRLYRRPKSLAKNTEMHFIKFENIETNLKATLRSLNIPNNIDLPHLKKGNNYQDDFILNVTTPEEMQAINDYFDDEFDLFEYQKIDPKQALYRG
jgi:hypothetical protein